MNVNPKQETEAEAQGPKARVYALQAVPTFTAAEISAAVGKTKRAVLMSLSGIDATETRIVRGISTRAWAYQALPTMLRAEMEAHARVEGIEPSAWLQRKIREASAGLHRQVVKPSVNVEALRLLDYWKQELAAPFELVPAIASVKSRVFVWREICEAYQHQAALEPGKRGILQKTLLSVVYRTWPNLAKSEAGLRRNFERKLAVYTSGGGEALEDKRPTRSGHSRALCEECWNNFLIKAGRRGGNESEAWRMMKQGKELCPKCDALHYFDIHSKSRMPDAVRNKATPIVEHALQFAKSDAAGRMAGPYISRSYDSLSPADRFWGDDVTWNHVAWDQDPSGRRYLCRPECLYAADFATSYPLAFVVVGRLIDSQKASYNATHVKKLMLLVHDLVGLPHHEWLFENGVWRAALVHDGAPRGKATEVAWHETQDAFKSLKDVVEIQHARARTPRTKLEGDFKILQQMMRELPGFVGFNEREEKTDRMKDLERRVRQGEDPARLGILSLDQYREAIAQTIWAFANATQNGKRLPGKSPAQAWEEAIRMRPLRKLADEDRWILATHRLVTQVGRKGIVYRDCCYCNDELSQYFKSGEKVTAFFNVDCPDRLVVLNRQHTHRFVVPAIVAPANACRVPGGLDVLTHAERNKSAFNKRAKALAGVLPHRVVSNVTRDTLTSADEKDLGSFISRTKEDRENEQNEARRDLRQVGRQAEELGIRITQTPRNAQKVIEGLDLEREALAEIEAAEGGTKPL